MLYQVLLVFDEDFQQEREERKIGELSGDFFFQLEFVMGYFYLFFFDFLFI